ncbi:breast carcinoma-amplified sequence 4 isoform X2 [Pteropus alecto]|uniref:breast carcinoma-amplified sequence 4 isoform X2 n=1 Tax=Pteropus alecto TaxID=9402 RepID=UPI000D53B81E|nr:breast carcinoma-amplified sequence 4 isoform X2 [Pteropus alecto]
MGAKEAVGDQWPLGGQGPAPFRFFAVPSGDARIGTLGEGRTRKKKVRTTVHAKEVEETIEGLLLRLEEFCSLTDMLRNQHGTLLLTEPHQLPAGVFILRPRLRSHPASSGRVSCSLRHFPCFRQLEGVFVRWFVEGPSLLVCLMVIACASHGGLWPSGEKAMGARCLLITAYQGARDTHGTSLGCQPWSAFCTVT